MIRNRISDEPPQDDLPLITEISRSRPLTRREHICTVCGKPIAIGSRYHRYVIRDDEAPDPRKALHVRKLHIPFCEAEVFYDERI